MSFEEEAWRKEQMDIIICLLLNFYFLPPFNIQYGSVWKSFPSIAAFSGSLFVQNVQKALLSASPVMHMEEGPGDKKHLNGS